MKHPQWDLQPAVTQLSSEPNREALTQLLEKVGWKPKYLLLELLKDVGWQRTGKDILEQILFPIFPAVPSECAIVRHINKEPHVLLWYRDDEHYKGHHMPGKYLLRGEDDKVWVERTIAAETGLTLKRFEFIRRFNTRPETGWVPGQQIGHLWYCEVEMEGESREGEFYPLTALPEDTLGHHKKYMEYLRAFFLRRETMWDRGIKWDGRAWPQPKAPEWKWLCNVVDTMDGWTSPVIHDTLDGALAHTKQCDSPVILFDDQGWEITRSENLP